MSSQTTDAQFSAELNSVDRLLLWAAGVGSLPPSIDSSESDEALERLDHHCVLGRFIERCAGDTGPAPGGDRFVAACEARFKEIQSVVAAQVRAVREVADRIGDERIILLKGMTTYMLTGRRETLRVGDVDLASSLGERLGDVFLELGYVRTREPFMHELGEYTRGRTEMDVHSYFPIYGLPSTLDGADLRPDSNPDVWVQRHRVAARDISFDRLASSRWPGKVAEAADIEFAGPELLALIIAGHSFMNYTNAWSISHREKPYVRLGELLDIEALVALPDFDIELFAASVVELGALDAVRWVNVAGQKLLGREMIEFNSATRSSSDRLPPRCIWWDLWLDVQPSTKSLIETEWWDVDAIVSSVGGQVQALGTWCDADQRVIRTSPNAPAFATRVDIGRKSSTISIKVDPAILGSGVRVRIDTGQTAEEIKFSAADAVDGVFTHETSDPSSRRPSSMLIGVATTESDGEVGEAAMVLISVATS